MAPLNRPIKYSVLVFFVLQGCKDFLLKSASMGKLDDVETAIEAGVDINTKDLVSIICNLYMQSNIGLNLITSFDFAVISILNENPKF